MSTDDKDIKIFTSSQSSDHDSDVLNLVESIDHHRRNGNVGRARKLGKDLADIAFAEQTQTDLQESIPLSSDVVTEMGVLLLFSTEAALNYFLPTAQLSAIAIDSLHNKLGKTKSEFYTNVVESPAYSFYYLSVRKGGADVSRDIGEAFAMLCHHEGEPRFIEKGMQIYNLVLKEVEHDVKEAGFED